MRFETKRDVTPEECPWLDETVHSGTTVYRCVKHTYGCVGPRGMAATYNPEGDYPFFELPTDSLRAVE